jgi:hypothetical protein
MPVSKNEAGERPVDAMMRVMDGRRKSTILRRLLDRSRRRESRTQPATGTESTNSPKWTTITLFHSKR